MNFEEEATITDYIIAMLCSARSKYIYRRILWERVQKRRKLSKAAFNQALYRLRRDNVVSGLDKVKFINQRKSWNNLRMIRKKPDGTKKILVLFDIPEKKKKIREWLREQLKWWDFEMIQKSAWVGKGPMPREFTKRLDDLGIKGNIRIFSVNYIKN